jgi:hypothetical protein
MMSLAATGAAKQQVNGLSTALGMAKARVHREIGLSIHNPDVSRWRLRTLA